MAKRSRGCGASSIRPRSRPLPTARSGLRSSSLSASLHCRRSGSRPGCCWLRASCSPSWRCPTPRALRRCRKRAALRHSSAGPSTTRRDSSRAGALFLDYLIVIALVGLFTAHYLGHALGWEALTDSPWDVVVAIGVIVLLGIVRLVRRSGPLPARGGGRRACVRHPLPHRRARLRVPRLVRCPFSRRRPRPGADLGRDRIRASAGDACLHGPRDGCEPR